MVLLLPLGAIVGFFFGGILAGIVALLLSVPIAVLGIVGTFVFMTALPLLLAPLALGLLPLTALFVGLLCVFVVTALFYMLATLGVLGPIAATPLSLTAGTPLPAAPLELFGRGLLSGSRHPSTSRSGRSLPGTRRSPPSSPCSPWLRLFPVCQGSWDISS